MRDRHENPEILQLVQLPISDQELGRAIRVAMATEDHQRATAVEDDHGDPLPRLDLSDSHPTTSDPLLGVGYALLNELPADWFSAVLAATAAGDEVRTSVMIRKQGDASFVQQSRYLPAVAEACSALRRSIYDADGRVWYNLIVRLERNGTVSPVYDFDQPPFLQWGPREVDLVLRDQELYPRDRDRLPTWHPAR